MIPVLDKFESLDTYKLQFYELEEVLAEGGNWQIPDSLALVSEPLK
ncbi:MAG UNVERIFIED_CONTAM: hypothetical protein LVR29_06280 [Microcystis novacekii LVE1205-3]